VRSRKSPLVSLKKQSDFKFVYKNGLSAAMPLFVVYAAKNDLGVCRLGVSASKKIGNAVRRNRVRRLVQECARRTANTGETSGSVLSKPETACGFDIIVIARPPSANLPREGSFVAVSAALSKLLARLGVVL